nr:glycosyltransferase [uncultured Desulfobacter sp.]
MPLLQRIRLSKSSALQPLYFQIDGEHYIDPDGGCTLKKGSICTLDSFYNACFIGTGGWPISVGRLACRLFLKGSFDVSFVFHGKSGRKVVLLNRLCLDTDLEKYYDFLMPQLPETTGRVYPVLRSLASNSTFRNGEYICENNAGAAVQLGLVVCTYKRERELLRTLWKIYDDPFLKDLHVVVVDNARTLSADQIPDSYCLIPNQNLGGAGGFSRGLLALLAQGECTHAILMDDDVQLDTETLLRTKKHFEYSSGTAIAGALMSLENPCYLNEAGADIDPVNLLQVIPQHCGINLGHAEGLSLWQKWCGAQYGGFWFFAFPLEIVQDIGMILPFFIKADDIEFGLRLTKKMSIDIQAGVCVHHPDFMSFDLAKRYYWVRNMLIVRMLQNVTLSHTVRGLFLEALKEFFTGRSDFLLAFVHGVQDCLKGPCWLKATDDQDVMITIKIAFEKKIPIFFLWGRAVLAILKYAFIYNKLKMQWRAAAVANTSVGFWKKRLGLV